MNLLTKLNCEEFTKLFTLLVNFAGKFSNVARSAIVFSGFSYITTVFVGIGLLNATKIL